MRTRDHPDILTATGSYTYKSEFARKWFDAGFEIGLQEALKEILEERILHAWAEAIVSMPPSEASR